MNNIVLFVLTLLSVYCTILVLVKINNRFFNKNKYRQTDLHLALKPFIFSDETNKNKNSQMDNMLQKNSINVIIVDNKAYWVMNNVFYMADFVDGDVDPSTSKPIDTNNMSETDIEKMFLILDTLGDGNNHDSGGTG